MGYVTWPRPFQGRFLSSVFRRLGLAMFNPYIKFEMSTTTYNEVMKGNAICKNSRFAPSFGDLGVTHRVHLWLDEMHAVDVLLAIIAILVSSHVCGTIKRNLLKSAFSDGGGSL